MTDKNKIQQTLEKHGLTIEAKFVPFSQSRNKSEKQPSLNWVVTLKKNGRIILSTDYSAGCGHAPSYGQRQHKDKIIVGWMVDMECETGFKCRKPFGELFSSSSLVSDRSRPILPDTADVIYSLLIDSEVIEYGDFESWASEFGYDTDSRQAEKTYNACFAIALKFRVIGQNAIDELKEVYQDY